MAQIVLKNWVAQNREGPHSNQFRKDGERNDFKGRNKKCRYGNCYINLSRNYGKRINSTGNVRKCRKSGNGNNYRDNDEIFRGNGTNREGFGNCPRSGVQDKNPPLSLLRQLRCLKVLRIV